MKKYLIAFALILVLPCTPTTPVETNHKFLVKGYVFLASITGFVSYFYFNGKDPSLVLGSIGTLGATYCALKGAQHAIEALSS